MYVDILNICFELLLFTSVMPATKFTVYLVETFLHVRPGPGAYPSLHRKSQELLNQPCEVNVAFGMRVQMVHAPPVALAHPKRYSPVLQVLHSATLHELLNAPCELK